MGIENNLKIYNNSQVPSPYKKEIEIVLLGGHVSQYVALCIDQYCLDVTDNTNIYIYCLDVLLNLLHCLNECLFPSALI